MQAKYDAAGYQLSFDYNLTSEEYTQQMKSLFEDSSLFDSRTIYFAGIIMDFYQPSLDVFSTIQFGFEFTIDQSLVLPTTVQVSFYRSRAYENSTQVFLFAMMILRLLLCTYTIWLIVLKLKYRKVLPSVAVSVCRDIVQVMLSLVPSILLLAHVEMMPIGTLLDPNEPYVSFADLA